MKTCNVDHSLDDLGPDFAHLPYYNQGSVPEESSQSSLSTQIILLCEDFAVIILTPGLMGMGMSVGAKVQTHKSH